LSPFSVVEIAVCGVCMSRHRQRTGLADGGRSVGRLHAVVTGHWLCHACWH